MAPLRRQAAVLVWAARGHDPGLAHAARSRAPPAAVHAPLLTAPRCRPRVELLQAQRRRGPARRRAPRYQRCCSRSSTALSLAWAQRQAAPGGAIAPCRGTAAHLLRALHRSMCGADEESSIVAVGPACVLGLLCAFVPASGLAASMQGRRRRRARRELLAGSALPKRACPRENPRRLPPSPARRSTRPIAGVHRVQRAPIAQRCPRPERRALGAIAPTGSASGRQHAQRAGGVIDGTSIPSDTMRSVARRLSGLDGRPASRSLGSLQRVGPPTLRDNPYPRLTAVVGPGPPLAPPSRPRHVL